MPDGRFLGVLPPQGQLNLADRDRLLEIPVTAVFEMLDRAGRLSDIGNPLKGDFSNNRNPPNRLLESVPGTGFISFQ